MKISTFCAVQAESVISLFAKVFADAEGPDEGNTVACLVSDLISTADDGDIMGFVADLEEEIVGCIFFSRLTLSNEQAAFLLSPVAVATDQQGKGIGQELIRFGVEHLRSKQVDLVFTYGDPDFYSKVGFQQLREDVVRAPFSLTRPEGWLAQTLRNGVIEAIDARSQCVQAFAKPEYW